MRTLLFLATLVMLTIPAQADAPCYTTSTPTAVIPDATGHAGGDLYIVSDPCQPVIGDGSCVFSIWIYQESNGIPGLQRDDPSHNDVANCHDGTRADTISIF